MGERHWHWFYSFLMFCTEAHTFHPIIHPSSLYPVVSQWMKVGNPPWTSLQSITGSTHTHKSKTVGWRPKHQDLGRIWKASFQLEFKPSHRWQCCPPTTVLPLQQSNNITAHLSNKSNISWKPCCIWLQDSIEWTEFLSSPAQNSEKSNLNAWVFFIFYFKASSEIFIIFLWTKMKQDGTGRVCRSQARDARAALCRKHGCRAASCAAC